MIAGAIIATLLITAQLAMAAQKNVRGIAIEWEDSTWLLADDGELLSNTLFITMRHELGHSLGLNHTSNGQYYGMPDGYTLGTYDDVMNAVLLVDDDYNTYSQRTITSEDVTAIKSILANHNFENPQPQTKKVVTTKQIDRAVFKS